MMVKDWVYKAGSLVVFKKKCTERKVKNFS